MTRCWWVDSRKAEGFLVTVACLPGQRTAEWRAPSGPDPFEPFVDHMVKRLTEDPPRRALTLFEWVVELGLDRSDPTFTRALRTRGCVRRANRAARQRAGLRR